MANGWLNKSVDENNRTVLTASEKDTDGQAVTRVKFKEPPLVQLSGSNLDKRDLAANKPAANTVPVGTTFWSVDTDPKGDAVEVSNGTAWVVL